MSGDHGPRRPLEGSVAAVQQRDHLFARQVAALHLVEGQQSAPLYLGMVVVQPLKRRRAVGNRDQGVDLRVLQEPIAAGAALQATPVRPHCSGRGPGPWPPPAELPARHR